MIMFNPPHPGEILREDYMNPLKLTINGLAEALGVSQQNISEIVNERKGISSEMAIRLSKAFSTSPQLWIGMQAEYDLWQASQKTINHVIPTLYREQAS